MPAVAANAKNFLLNSDYPQDKVVLLLSGSIPIDSATHTIPHNLPFTPLVDGCWSMTSDFSTSYEFYSGDFPSGNPGYFFAHEVQLQANSTNVILPTLDIAGGSKTAYYRIFGFEPSDSTADIASPITSSDNFVLNTDYNYMKLYTSGVANPGTAATYTIVHGLGYKPQVRAWYTVAGISKPTTQAGDAFAGRICVVPTDTSIIVLNPNGDNITRFDYRMYFDD